MKKLFVFFVIIFISIQFYRPYKNSSNNINSNDFIKSENIPTNIAKIFLNSCYDCHSNNTNYTWYDNIAPLSWYVDNNIKKAKFSLNFSNWGSFEPWRRRVFFQGGIIYDININKMPPSNYLFLHKNSNISKAQKIQIQDWINTINLRN